MSDTTPPSPYGDQPPNPYGEQPSPYDQAYAAPSSSGGYGTSGADPDKRPGTVTAAGWITIVFSVLTLIASVFVIIALLVARDDVTDELRSDAAFNDLDVDQIVGVGVGIFVVIALWCIGAVVLGVMVMRRSKIARILLVVSSALAALISLLGILSLISALPLIAAIAVIVLLFAGGANAWFAGGKGGDQSPPPLGTTAY